MPVHHQHEKYPKAGPAGTGGGQRKVGIGWDGRRRRGKQDKTRKQAGRQKQPKKNVDWLTDKESRGREKAGGRPRVDSGEVSVGLVRRCAARRRGKGKYISKAVVEGRLDKTAVEVGRRARQRHTVVWSSYHFSFRNEEKELERFKHQSQDWLDITQAKSISKKHPERRK
ncbi:hypothetical protein BY996DRAFT_6463708 [Phakopsora pachyrhizi]|nr:hypothetical protein BY996DRAFT_6463708 [Phakopsora pachyrhizi]